MTWYNLKVRFRTDNLDKTVSPIIEAITGLPLPPDVTVDTIVVEKNGVHSSNRRAKK